MTLSTRVRKAVRLGEGFALHVAAVVAGLVLMIVGAAMGVTIALIPLGVPIGFLGFGMFLWGLLEWIQRRREERQSEEG